MALNDAQSSLTLTDGHIVYSEADGREVWRLPVADVLLIGEYTTAAGPADDYFLEFGHICDGEPCFTECPTPGDAERFFAELGVVLNAALRLKLGAVTTLASRVVWPVRLAGRPVFVQQETARLPGLAEVRRRLFGGDTEWVVSTEVFEAILAGSAMGHSKKP